MSYKLNKTDGSLLVELVDGQIDNTSSDITLIGRNYSGFGEILNENFIKLLENFSNSASPSNPIKGQLWFDSSENRLKIYDGGQWKANGPIISATQPQMVAGDLWINNSDNKLYFFDGSDIVLVGPEYTAKQGFSGFEVVTIVDTRSINYTVIKWFIGNSLFAIISNDTFTPREIDLDLIPGITGEVKKGINFIDKDNFRIFGVADAADSLITAEVNPTTGELIRKTASQFLPSDSTGTTIGTINIQNKGGLTIGDTGQASLQISGDYLQLTSNLTGQNFRLVSSNINGQFDALRLDTENGYLGVNVTEEEPTATLDVFGSLRVREDLIIDGNSVNIESQNLRVADYNIELGYADTILTLSGKVKADFVDGISVGDTITQTYDLGLGPVVASGTFKEYSSNTLTNTHLLTITPFDNNFISDAGAPLVLQGVGTFVEEDSLTQIYPISAAQRSDNTANGAGIIIKGAPSSTNAFDKTLTWVNDVTNGPYFEFNDSLNLADNTKSYKINDHDVLTATALGNDIITAPGLEDVGILTRLRIRQSSSLPGPGLQITYDEGSLPAVPTLTTYNAGLKIASFDTVDFNDTKIKNVLKPISQRVNLENPINVEDDDDFVATKGYVDEELEAHPITMTLDTTGMPVSPYTTKDQEIEAILTFMHPPTSRTLNCQARLITTSYTGAVTGIDIASAMTKESAVFDFTNITGADGGDASQVLLEDVNFVDGTGDVALLVTRNKQVWEVRDEGSGKFWKKIVDEVWS